MDVIQNASPVPQSTSGVAVPAVRQGSQALPAIGSHPALPPATPVSPTIQSTPTSVKRKRDTSTKSSSNNKYKNKEAKKKSSSSAGVAGPSQQQPPVAAPAPTLPPPTPKSSNASPPTSQAGPSNSDSTTSHVHVFFRPADHHGRSAAVIDNAPQPNKPALTGSGPGAKPIPSLKQPPTRQAPPSTLKTTTRTSRIKVSTRKFVPLRTAAPTQQQTNQARRRVTITADSSPPPLSFPLIPLLPDATSENRVEHIRSHFLERLFINLSGARDTPAARAAQTHASAHSPASLAFQGFRPDVFDCDVEAFEVALRWWLARLHTTLQLGSAQSWSVMAGGIGLLGPDMTQWPIVTECKKIVEGIYIVVTAPPTAFPEPTKRVKKGRQGPSSDSQPSSASKLPSRYLVIAETGDVVATDLPLSIPTSCVLEGCEVRPDWLSYIREQQAAASTSASTILNNGVAARHIMSLVKTKDDHSSPSGINKAWRDGTNATASALQGGSDAVRVAERAVLNSCSLNR